MIINAVRITNFGSFQKTQEFRFPKGPGLFFMWGDNQANPRLQGNGAGKSTLWSAITWCIFGKSTRGLKAGDAANWDAGKATVVEIDFTSPSGEDCTVRRTWGPISWTLHWPDAGYREDLTKANTNPLLGWIGLDYQPWLSCILMAQSQPFFLDLNAGAKASLFSEIMQLDHWLEYSDRASAKAKVLGDKITENEKEAASLAGHLASMEQQDWDGKAKGWERARQERLKDLETQYLEVLARQDKDKLDLELYEKEEDEKRHLYANQLVIVDSETDALRALKDRLANARETEARIMGRIDAINQRGQLLLKNEECPTCGQTLHKGSVLSLLDAELDEAVEKHKSADAECTRLAKECDTQADSLGNDKALLNTYTQALDSALSRMRAVQRAVAAADKDLDELEARSTAIEKEVNPIEEMRFAMASQVHVLEDLASDLNLTLQDQRETLALAQNWVKWFKEIRLSQIAEALGQLEIEVNSSVIELGLVGWELHFDVDRETAKGTLQRGFTVAVVSPQNPKPVPWEAWSGGETQRLRLAGNAGLSNLIRARTGVLLDLEVWDEPTQFLSPQGVQDLLESLAARAQAEQRQIWVVDHRTLGFSGFTGTAGVVKTNEGSKFDLTGVYLQENGAPRHTDTPASPRPVLHDVGRRARTLDRH